MGQGSRKGTRNQIEVRENIHYSFVPNHRETMQALARADLTGHEYRVVIALMNQTNGYLREEDAITGTFWQALTFLRRQSVHKALRRLIDKGIIAKSDGRYRVKPPNEWHENAFGQPEACKRATHLAAEFIEKEKEPQHYRWLKNLLKPSPTGDASAATNRPLQGTHRPPQGTHRPLQGALLGGAIGGGRRKPKESLKKERKIVSRRKRRAPPDPRVKEVLDAMQAEFGFPDKTDIDPIPNYGSEGQHIKRMLARGFTPMAILAVWRGKVKQRHEFVSMHWVNQDIGKEVAGGKAVSGPESIEAAKRDYERRTGIYTG